MCSPALDLTSNSLNNHSRGKLYFSYGYTQYPVQAYLKLGLIVTRRMKYTEYMLDQTCQVPALELELGVEAASLEVLALKVVLGEHIPDRQMGITCSRQSSWLLNVVHSLVFPLNVMQLFI